MTDTAATPEPAAIDELPGGPYDIEFFFDPGCPFAWQTSVWIRKVVELRDIKVGWRFISLKFINEGREESADMRTAHERGLAYHRVCAAARDRIGNDAVGDLYRAWGERFWSQRVDGDFVTKFTTAFGAMDVADIVASLDLPADLVAEAGNDEWDAIVRAESDEAFRRTGEDVGTPIITFSPPTGNSLFGPVISSVPDDDATVVSFYDALRVFADYPGFSELKRTKRPPIDLPLLAD